MSLSTTIESAIVERIGHKRGRRKITCNKQDTKRLGRIVPRFIE
jgi:hypothetical protein